MNRRVAFFNVDTQQVSEDNRSLVFRPRIESIAPEIKHLLRIADERDIFVLSSACVNAGPVHRVLGPDTLFIPIEAPPTAWERSLAGVRRAFLEKRTCGAPAVNIRERVFDVFHGNPNAERVVRALDIPHWVVFGDSAGYCFRSTVEGLLALGCRVTALTDVVGKGIDTEEEKAAILHELESRGASLQLSKELLSGDL